MREEVVDGGQGGGGQHALHEHRNLSKSKKVI